MAGVALLGALFEVEPSALAYLLGGVLGTVVGAAALVVLPLEVGAVTAASAGAAGGLQGGVTGVAVASVVPSFTDEEPWLDFTSQDDPERLEPEPGRLRESQATKEALERRRAEDREWRESEEGRLAAQRHHELILWGLRPEGSKPQRPSPEEQAKRERFEAANDFERAPTLGLSGALSGAGTQR
ncbi:MAG: hypothetical protein KDD82_31170 [Planctomycetes bacterium]|nr:hypothetical protein [Planctomycetota bacterium]